MRNHMAAVMKLIFLLTFIASVCLSAPAQSQANSGNIEGRVLDPNGAAVPGVTVTATNQETGLSRSAESDSEGSYRIIALPPGKYTVTSKAPSGFVSAPYSNAIVTVGSHTPLDIQLVLSGADTVSVDVSTAGELVETTRTSVATTINQTAIDNLLINHRNFQDFATLSPGVVRDPRGGDLSVGGQRGTFNSLQVDGADNNNTFFGQAFGRGGVRPPYQFSEESVQEFQVNQNGFSAEFGRAGGAVINVVTRSGTNEFHGGLFEYFRDESLNANDPALKGTQARDFQAGRRLNNNKRPPSQINQFGGRIGGPIVKNRAFFFFTYDGQRQTLPNPIDVPNFFAQPVATQNLL